MHHRPAIYLIFYKKYSNGLWLMIMKTVLNFSNAVWDIESKSKKLLVLYKNIADSRFYEYLLGTQILNKSG